MRRASPLLLLLLLACSAGDDTGDGAGGSPSGASGHGGAAGSPALPGPRALVVASVKDVGAVAIPPKVTGRDGGPSGIVGGKLLWTFGDTFWPFKADDGATFRTNTAALADLSAPLAASEPVDSQGAPQQFIPFTDEEKQFNDATGKPDDRIAIWPGSVVTQGNGGLVFFLKLHVKPGTLNYEFLGTGIARVEAGSTSATRETGLIFGPTDPHFNLAALLDDALYVYGDLPAVSGGFGVARVSLASVADRSAYRFWDGHDWVTDVSKTAVVLGDIPGGVSVSYNAYLRQYLAVHSVPLSDEVVMHTAPRPEGPWSEPIKAFTGAPPGNNGGLAVDYSGIEHPELSRDGGRTVSVSYAHPLPGFLEGEVRLVEVTFE